MQAIAIRHPQKISDLSEVPDLHQWRRKAFGRDIVDIMKHVR
jgi:hypothetical protein